MKLDGQIAVITGSGRGIGRAIALAYAREGAKLALAARSETELQETVSAVSELGAEAIAVRTDVTSQEDTERLAHRVVERFGRIDVLVNNAGNSGPVGPLHVNDIADWVNTINVNLTGTFLVCRAVIPVMLERSGGKIINLSGAGATNAWSNMSGLLLQQSGGGTAYRSAGPGTGWQGNQGERPRAGLGSYQHVGQDDRASRPGGCGLHSPARAAGNVGRRRVHRRVRRVGGVVGLKRKRGADRQTDLGVDR